MIKIYGDLLSGNCYKIKLLLAFLKKEHQWIHINILEGESQTDDYLKMNANGKIPLLELESGAYLSESNAILNYLAEDSIYLPDDPWFRAKVLEWQFFEQYSHEPYIAVARYIAKYLGLPKDKENEYQAKQQGGHRALKVMETRLADNDFFVGESLSIADIALYGYTHVAYEGGFNLNSYPAIQKWLTRIEQQPNYIAMVASLADSKAD